MPTTTISGPKGRPVSTALEEAIFVQLGGSTKACHALQVSTQAVQKLLTIGYVSSRAKALKIQELTGIPAGELMQVAPWRGLERAAAREEACLPPTTNATT
jgi:hypothetical protein